MIVIEAAGVAVVGGSGAMLYNAWRSPEKACLRCNGAGWRKAVSLIFRVVVRGACRKCGGRGWYPRRLSRFFGWTADTHRW
jgi:DnaJ-class molecular chaperone